MSDSPLAVAGALFEAIGHALICLDEESRVVYASSSLPAGIVGRSIEEIVEPRLMSVIAAPFPAREYGVHTVVVLRPCEDEPVILRSPAMQQIAALVENLRASDASILLTGEKGTGKEVLARTIHARSARRDGHFVAVRCAALPQLDAAAGDTLFLDDVSDLPLHLQAELLRIAQEPNGVRVIAATSADLRRAVADSRFREDLFRELRAVHIDIPPLHARREDIEPLATHFLARTRRPLAFSPDAMRALLRYRWPGNVRELESAVAYAAAVARESTVHADDLPPDMAEPAAPGNGEAASIRAALESHRWNRETTARALGMSRTTLWRKMRELGLL
jgi:DNA-binding NtrC family response regulator